VDALHTKHQYIPLVIYEAAGDEEDTTPRNIDDAQTCDAWPSMLHSACRIQDQDIITLPFVYIMLIDNLDCSKTSARSHFARMACVQMEFFEYPLRAPNNFDLSLMRTGKHSSAESGHHHDVQDDTSFSLRIDEPSQGAILVHPFVTVSFQLLPSRYNLVCSTLVFA
jgi:hypothetical protein